MHVTMHLGTSTLQLHAPCTLCQTAADTQKRTTDHTENIKITLSHHRYILIVYEHFVVSGAGWSRLRRVRLFPSMPLNHDLWAWHQDLAWYEGILHCRTFTVRISRQCFVDKHQCCFDCPAGIWTPSEGRKWTTNWSLCVSMYMAVIPQRDVCYTLLQSISMIPCGTWANWYTSLWPSTLLRIPRA